MDSRSADPGDLLAAAKRTVRRERRHIVDDARAFETFRAKIRDVPTATSPEPDGPLLIGTRSSRPDASPVRDAYEAVVMDLPHYADEYDDTYAESLEGEFGPDVASALLEGCFTEPCKRALLAAGSDARDRRTRFLDELDDERRSLETAERTVRQVLAGLDSLDDAPVGVASFEDATADRSTLVGMERRCRSLASDRQAAIHEHSFTPGRSADVRHLQEYLYADLARTYPVLAAVAETISRVEDLRGRYEGAIAEY